MKRLFILILSVSALALRAEINSVGKRIDERSQGIARQDSFSGGGRNNGFGPGGFGNGGFGGGMGGGGGGAQSNGQSRKAAEEISKLGQEASKGIQENLKNFSQGQEKSMQNFFSSLKDTQVKEDNQKLLESLSKESSAPDSQAAGISGITDSIVKAIDENAKTRIQAIEIIGQMLTRPKPQPAKNSESIEEKLAKLPPSSARSPLGSLMGLSSDAGNKSSEGQGQQALSTDPSARGAKPYNWPVRP